MDGGIRENDISRIVELDRAHIWHHLIQHKPFETSAGIISIAEDNIFWPLVCPKGTSLIAANT